MLMEYIHIILKQSHKPVYTWIIMLILSLTRTSQGGGRDSMPSVLTHQISLKHEMAEFMSER